MIPKAIANATAIITPPRGWDEELGDCRQLHVRSIVSPHGLVVESAWEPTPHELELLNAGGSVILRVAGGQPPVMLFVEARATGEEDGNG